MHVLPKLQLPNICMYIAALHLHQHTIILYAMQCIGTAHALQGGILTVLLAPTLEVDVANVAMCLGDFY